MCVVVQGYEVEEDDSEEASDIDQRCIYIFTYDLGTLLVACLVIFEVLSSVIFAPAEQCGKVFLLVFASRVDIETSGNICRLAVFKEAQSIGSGLDAIDLSRNLHCDMFICGTIVLVDNLIAGRTRFQDICPLFFIGSPGLPVSSSGLKPGNM